MTAGTDGFPALVARVLAADLAADPVSATFLGEHRHDGALPDHSQSAHRRRRADLVAQLADLDTVAVADTAESVDRAIVQNELRAQLYQLDEVRGVEWNPMLHNPGNALHSLLSRDFAPLAERLVSLADRLRTVPDYLATARDRLSEMSRIHLDTAVGQLDGTVAVIEDLVPAAAREAGTAPAGLDGAAADAGRAVTEFRDWLIGRAADATYDARRGSAGFETQLALTLDTGFDAAALLARAEEELADVTEQIVAAAGEIAGESQPDQSTVRGVLDRLAAAAPDDSTILGLCRSALAGCTDFVRDHELVSVFDDPIVIVEMPEIDRGVAVAYCRPAGPLERTPPPTEFAVSPTPAGWTPQQVRSFYREYNEHMLHNLTAHEAMPGHALQLAHANRYRGSTPVRAIWWSGSFVEGWAVYAEELLVRHGYRGEQTAALRMQQLKMQLRMIINTIMDVRYHAGDLDEAAAMALMTGRGFQERGEALGKWRRVQLTATQLSTYFVGYREVSDLIADLRAAHPDWSQRRLHDTVLAHGSPPVRRLRPLLGLS